MFQTNIPESLEYVLLWYYQIGYMWAPRRYLIAFLPTPGICIVSLLLARSGAAAPVLPLRGPTLHTVKKVRAK